MTNQNPFLILNPASGGYSERRVRHITAELSRHGLEPQLVLIRSPQEAAQFFNINYSCTVPPLIIVAAGDGTVNAVLNCFEPGVATLAVLPLGTSNVLASELGITSLDDGLERIIQGETRPLSAGLLQLEGRRHYFVLMAGIGLDGAVVRDVRPPEKRLLKQGAFVLSALRNACSWDRELIEVVSGGQSISCHTVVVCNASRYGGNFVLAPEADLFSPGLIAVCVTSGSHACYLKIASNLFWKRTGHSSDMIRVASGEVEILGRKPIQIDGDFVGYGPARISAVANFASIVI